MGSFLELNFRPLYKKVLQVLHCTEKGSIIRTGTVPSFFDSALPRGTRDGSKSAGKYLLRTFRSPILADYQKNAFVCLLAVLYFLVYLFAYLFFSVNVRFVR
mmetsp:Transcript_25692/g.56344  ORF Transcript_25692/g.56344 Transcript_25692/m.56344 type:complete len:102 (+) Transcript_25692:1699-2004(+)